MWYLLILVYVLQVFNLFQTKNIIYKHKDESQQ